ncbi:MAG: hypothetical protein ACE5NC_09760, partial [Anaerolineae bacterium]
LIDSIDRFATGIYWAGNNEDHTLYIDDSFGRDWVDPEPTTGLGSEETAANVQITVSVHHTNASGGDPQLIISTSTTVDSTTTDPLNLGLGSGLQQTFTSGDPRVLRVQVEVTAVNGGEQFVLDYDGACASSLCSSLDTPTVTVPEGVIGLAAGAILIPGLASLAWRRRRTEAKAAEMIAKKEVRRSDAKRT